MIGPVYRVYAAMAQVMANAMLSEDGNKPSLLDPKGESHILGGDATGGGHRFGIGIPEKSEFPESWSDEKIAGEISDVATDPSSSRAPAGRGRSIIRGTRNGIDIEVIVEPGGRIVTGYPTNVPRNPKWKMNRESYELIEPLLSELLQFLNQIELQKVYAEVTYYADVGEYGLAFEAALDGCAEWNQEIPNGTREVFEKLAKVMNMDTSILDAIIKR